MNELPESATGVLGLLASTSTQIDVFSDQVIESVKSGNENPLKVLIQLKAFEKCTERILKEIKENYMTEADKFPGSSFEFMGNTVVKADVRTVYNYTVCNDPKYNELAEALEKAELALKEREAFLKAVKAAFTLVDETSGEVVQILPAKVSRVPGLKISIK